MVRWPGAGGVGARAHGDESPATNYTPAPPRPAAATPRPAMQPAPEMLERQKLTQEDHQRLMDLLHMTPIRRGRDGNNKESPYYANYDEAKANPFPKLPDPLV